MNFTIACQSTTNVPVHDKSNYVIKGAPVSTKKHISFKANEVDLLEWELELMRHYKLNRSDLHKHFIRVHYQMLKMPIINWS